MRLLNRILYNFLTVINFLILILIIIEFRIFLLSFNNGAFFFEVIIFSISLIYFLLQIKYKKISIFLLIITLLLFSIILIKIINTENINLSMIYLNIKHIIFLFVGYSIFSISKINLKYLFITINILFFFSYFIMQHINYEFFLDLSYLNFNRVNPNVFSYYSVMMTILILYHVGLNKFFFMSLILTIALILLIFHSISSIFVLVFSIFIYLIFKSKYIYFFLSIFFSYILLKFAIFQKQKFYETIFSFNGDIFFSKFIDRKNLIYDNFYTIDSKFIFGHGLNLYDNLNSHNQFVNVLYINGVIGLLLYVFFIVYMFSISFKRDNDFLLGVSILITLLSFVSHNIFDYYSIFLFIGMALNFNNKKINLKNSIIKKI